MKVNVLSDVCHNMGIQIHLANTAKNIQNVKDISCTNVPMYSKTNMTSRKPRTNNHRINFVHDSSPYRWWRIYSLTMVWFDFNITRPAYCTLLWLLKAAWQLVTPSCTVLLVTTSAGFRGKAEQPDRHSGASLGQGLQWRGGERGSQPDHFGR